MDGLSLLNIESGGESSDPPCWCWCTGSSLDFGRWTESAPDGSGWASILINKKKRQ